MGDKAPAYQWYPKDYETDEAVKLMTYEQEGIYRRLLDHQALHGGIPADVRQIAMLCPKVPQKRFLALWPGIAGKFVAVDGKLVNQKLERVKANTTAFKETKSESGKLGAAKRWQRDSKTDGKPIAHAIANTSPASATASASSIRTNARHGDGGALERLMDAFRAHWKRAYGFESSLLLKPLEVMQLEQQLAGAGEPQLLAAMAAYFATEDPYVRNAKHPLPLFLRDPLKYLAKEARTSAGRPRGCKHEPACADEAAHTKRDLADRRVAS
jgi:hypothetical protein